MATFTAFEAFTQDALSKVHDIGNDDLRYLLTNDAPDAAADAARADLTSELAAGGGYLADGVVLENTTLSNTAGVTAVLTDDKTLTAAGGSIGPFRYVVLYNNTTASDRLIAFWDRGASITLADGDSVVFDADATNGLFRVGVGTIA